MSEVSASAGGKPPWAPRGYYAAYDLLAGSVLGLFGAATSLVFNIIGALLVAPPAGLGPDPLNLIRVYLTFPLGEPALATTNGVALAIGCCLYLATGTLLGIPFQIAQSKCVPDGDFVKRFKLVTGLAVGLWIVNFYLILSWLQPLLFGGRWIVDLIPWWVGLTTHLVFGWTMLLVYPLGVFKPYRQFESKT
ncbi:hypothetical protein [Planctomycetes bacterium Pan216]|uniref:hypothetical protein n=1 Tax=Kolteria novifilia TaxID=2527975 RepID=UPI0011A7462C